MTQQSTGAVYSSTKGKPILALLCRPGPVLYALLQIAALILAWLVLSQTGGCRTANLPRLLAGSFWDTSTPIPSSGNALYHAGGKEHSAKQSTQTAELQIEEVCQTEHAEELASRWLEHSSTTQNFTSCADKQWLLQLRELTSSGSKVFVDVGCGKGYASANLFGLWAPNQGITPRAIRGYLGDAQCGGCGDCEQEALSSAAPQADARVHVLCVEPHPLRYSHLVLLRQHLFAGSVSKEVQWRLLQAAVGSSGTEPAVARCPLREGRCSLGPQAKAGADPQVDLLPVVTLDELLDIHSLPHVDLLMIDTEGFELPALAGAMDSITAGRVGVLTFAYSGSGQGGHWRRGQLGKVVAQLAELDYACYMAGKQTAAGSLVRLTGCWSPSYEKLTPSSLVCVPRSHPLYPHTERMSLRYNLYQKAYYDQQDAQQAAAAVAVAADGQVEQGAKAPERSDKGEALKAVPHHAEEQVVGKPPAAKESEEPKERTDGVRQDDSRPAGTQPGELQQDVLPRWGQQQELERDKEVVVKQALDDAAANATSVALGAKAAVKAQAGANGSAPVTSNLMQWAAAPDSWVFQDPQSRCLLHPNGSAVPPPGWQSDSKVPFLFDTGSMPEKDTACQHCPAKEDPLLCCGVCIFERRRCDQFYPGQNKTEASAQHLLDNGYQLRAFTPCELFQRIRGRTLWFMGDSQTWHFYYSAECFLRNFAPTLHRVGPMPWALNRKLITVTWPVRVPPICLELALGTRVCAVRVDSVGALTGTVLPMLQNHTQNFERDLMVYNTGLHYGTPGVDGKPANASQLYKDLTSFVAFRRRYKEVLPKLIWMDIPVQHFSGPDGSYHGGQKPFTCKPLEAWYKGDPVVRGGGRRNIPIAPLVLEFADAHMRTWNASIPFWDTHKPDECTHWCSPSAYHLWLYLLNDVMRDGGLGNAAVVPQRSSMAVAAAVAAGTGGSDGADSTVAAGDGGSDRGGKG